MVHNDLHPPGKFTEFYHTLGRPQQKRMLLTHFLAAKDKHSVPGVLPLWGYHVPQQDGRRGWQ